MISQPNRYLLWLLLVLMPAAAISQSKVMRRSSRQVTQGRQPARSQSQLQPQQRMVMQDAGILVSRGAELQPGQMVVARRDTMVVTKRDTVIVEKKDTAYVTKYDTLSAAVLDQREMVYTGSVPDSVIEQAVQRGVMRALQMQGYSGSNSIFEPRTRAEQLWDRSQKKRHIQRVDREMLKAVFVPKKQWLLGATFNYQEWDTDNINLLVLKDMNIEGHTFSASPYFGYFVANNLALGGRYSYSRNYFYLGSFDLNLGEDFNISLEDLYYLEHTHEGAMFLRTYMPLGRSKMFGFFGEIRGSYAYTTGKNSTGSGADYDGSYGHTHTIKLSFCPGMAAFVTDFLAAEASIGIMGLKYRWQDQHTNRIESGKSQSGGANFKFNLLSINLGLTFYL